jgi:hypothetical protein
LPASIKTAPESFFVSGKSTFASAGESRQNIAEAGEKNSLTRVCVYLLPILPPRIRNKTMMLWLPQPGHTCTSGLFRPALAEPTLKISHHQRGNRKDCREKAQLVLVLSVWFLVDC